MNVIRVPSGDHAGSSALQRRAAREESGRRWSASTTAMCPPVTYAIRRPSGAQSGEKLERPLVSRRACLGGEVHHPDLELAAARALEGHASVRRATSPGRRSFATGVSKSGCADPRRTRRPTGRTCFVSDKRRKAIRRPSGDHVGSPSPASLVSRRWRTPSAFITQIPAANEPMPPPENAMRVRIGRPGRAAPPHGRAGADRRPDGSTEHTSGGCFGWARWTVRIDDPCLAPGRRAAGGRAAPRRRRGARLKPQICTE